jgi:hypothetical protein
MAGDNDDLTEIYIYPPSVLTTIQTNPSQLPIQYNCFIASILSFWFGFSLKSVPEILTTFYNKWKGLSNKIFFFSLNQSLFVCVDKGKEVSFPFDCESKREKNMTCEIKEQRWTPHSL